MRPQRHDRGYRRQRRHVTGELLHRGVEPLQPLEHTAPPAQADRRLVEVRAAHDLAADQSVDRGIDHPHRDPGLRHGSGRVAA
jgi:hypothetical protein